MCKCQTTTSCNSCQPKICTPQPICDCPGGYMSSDCVNNVKAQFECLNIESNQTLTETLEQMDLAICDKFSEFDSHFDLVNVGTGEDVYKGVNLLGQKEIKKLNKSGDLLIITPNTNDITLSINEQELENFVEDLIPSSETASNIGIGAEVYKQKTGDNFEFRKIKKTDLGSGVSTVSSVTTETDEVSINTRTVISSLGTLSIEIGDNGEIDINAPIDETVKSFYVNENFTGTSNGSITKPYKKLVDALVAMVGTGTLLDPQFPGANIILQTNTTVSTADLTANSILENKITVNTLIIEGNSNSIFFEGLDDYPISTRFLYTKAISLTDSVQRGINLTINNADLFCNAKGIVDNFCTGSTSQYFSSAISFTNCNIISSYGLTLPDYVQALNYDGSNVTQFGQDIKVQDSIVNNTPHIFSEGLNINNTGALSLNNCVITGSSQTCLKLKNTDFSSEKLEIGFNDKFINVTDVSITDGDYTPKTGVNIVDIDNAFFQILDYSDFQPYPASSISLGIFKGLPSSDKVFNLIGSGSRINIPKAYIYTGLSNNYVAIPTGVQGVLIDNVLTNRTFEDGAFIKNGSGADPTIILQNVFVNNVKETAISNVIYYSPQSLVNGYSFSTLASYPNDTDAKIAGLITGNVYYNTTTNSMKRIV